MDSKISLTMRQALYSRHHIPFYCDKTAKEFQQDPYERYDPMVLRQTALHLADEIWGHYPFQALIDWSLQHFKQQHPKHILELGCGTGRWIASIGQYFKDAQCWGVDYSYQMLKRAHEYWIEGKKIDLDYSNKGFGRYSLQHPACLENLQFGLAKAKQLPFDDSSFELLGCHFLLDRLEAPINALYEIKRVLQKGGLLLLTSPLNFTKRQQWEALYPASKLKNTLLDLGFEIKTWKENELVQEPLDKQGNTIAWNCVQLAATKI